MKTVLLFAAVAALSTPVLAQAQSVRRAPDAATFRAMDDREADAAAASDIAPIRPAAGTVTTTNIPASQIVPVQPSSTVSAPTAQSQPST